MGIPTDLLAFLQCLKFHFCYINDIVIVEKNHILL